MRLRGILLLASCALLCTAAAHDFQHLAGGGVILPVPPGDTHCPAATNAVFSCGGGIPPSAYLVFEKMKGEKGHVCEYVAIYGTKDMTTCPGYTLIHADRLAKPLAPPLPCTPVDCTPPK